MLGLVTYLTEKPLSLFSSAGEGGGFSAEESSSIGSLRGDPGGALQGFPIRTQGDCGRDCMDRIRALDTWLLKDKMIPRLSPSKPLELGASEEGLRGRLRVLTLTA